jgi:hypothetical protein
MVRKSWPGEAKKMNLNRFLLIGLMMLPMNLVWGVDANQGGDSIGEVTDFEAQWFKPANEDEQDKDNYILQTLDNGIHGSLQLGWFVPPRLVILDKKYPEVYFYSSSNEPLHAVFSKALTKEEADQYRKQSRITCDPSDSYFSYSQEAPDVKAEALVVASKDPLPQAKLGFEKGELSKQDLEAALKALGGRENFGHKVLCLKTLDGHFKYSFHALYDPKTKQLRKSGIVLQGSDGKVLAKSLERFDPAQAYNGCGIPTSDDPLEAIYSPLNLLQTSLFPYPLILMEADHLDAKILSLVTFDIKGAESEISATENVSGCK